MIKNKGKFLDDITGYMVTWDWFGAHIEKFDESKPKLKSNLVSWFCKLGTGRDKGLFMEITWLKKDWEYPGTNRR